MKTNSRTGLFSQYSIIIATLAMSVISSELQHEGDKSSVPKPCCFPSAFQATVADMRSAARGDMYLFELYRDWEKRMQVQRIMTFAPPGQVAATSTVYLDFKNSVQYMVTASGDCSSHAIDYAMLEPCMPDDATFLGETYLGFGVDTTHFQTWSFRRTDQGRNISMTVSVTAHDCVPVMEAISGTIGHVSVDTLITFTTFKPLQDASVLEVPPNCLALM